MLGPYLDPNCLHSDGIHEIVKSVGPDLDPNFLTL